MIQLLILYIILTCCISFLFVYNERCTFTYPTLTVVLITLLSPLLLPRKIYITYKKLKNEQDINNNSSRRV